MRRSLTFHAGPAQREKKYGSFCSGPSPKIGFVRRVIDMHGYRFNRNHGAALRSQVSLQCGVNIPQMPTIGLIYRLQGPGNTIDFSSSISPHRFGNDIQAVFFSQAKLHRVTQEGKITSHTYKSLHARGLPPLQSHCTPYLLPLYLVQHRCINIYRLCIVIH